MFPWRPGPVVCLRLAFFLRERVSVVDGLRLGQFDGDTDRSVCATYFLKRSSKAWRASLWRGGAVAAAAGAFWA